MSQTEQEFLASYRKEDYARDAVLASVDLVIFSVIGGKLHHLAIKRARHPEQGNWALPGGFIRPGVDTTLESVAKRVLKEKTGVDTSYLEQVCTYGGNDRDPRGWSITTSYMALTNPARVELNAGEGASEVVWRPVALGLAFKHDEIVADAIDRLKSKTAYTTLPVFLMPQYFTLPELQGVYETLLESKLDPKAFRTRINRVNVLEETGEMKKTSNRPAMLYKAKNTTPEYFNRSI